MKPESKTTIKIGDTVIDTKDLSQEERAAFIELAIHHAAPKLSELLTGLVRFDEASRLQEMPGPGWRPRPLLVQNLPDR